MSSLVTSPVFLKFGFSLILELTNWVDWLDRDLQGPVLKLRVHSAFMWVLGVTFMTSGSHGKPSGSELSPQSHVGILVKLST